MNNIDGMKFTLELIKEVRKKYQSLGWLDYDLSIDRVLKDVENEIGIRCFKNWKLK